MEKSCCFIGHRKIIKSKELKSRLENYLHNLITKENVTVFYFGSASEFNYYCRHIIDKLKILYPHIIRVYIRAEYQFISEDYKNYLLEIYDETYYPESISNSNFKVYIKRNKLMIDKSDYCIFYYDDKYLPNTKIPTKSGTKTAYEYAIKKGKIIKNFFI